MFEPIRPAAAALALALALEGCVTAADGGGVGGAGAGDASGTVPSVPIATVPLPATAASAATAVVPDSLPPGLVGRTWAVEAGDGSLVAGVTGSAARTTLPAGDRVLAVGPGTIATVRAADVGWRVRVVGVATGLELAVVDRGDEPLSAAFAGERLVLGGHQPGVFGRDPGVVAISLADGRTTTLLAPRTARDRATELARTVVATPDGRIVSGLCGLDGCEIDLIDPTDGSTRRLSSRIPAWPGPATDAVALIGEAESAWIAGLDLASGARRWTRSDGEFQHAYATGDGAIVQALVGEDLTFRLELLDPATGRGRVVFERSGAEGLVLWPELSNERYAVVSSDGNLADVALEGRVVRAGVVDLASGEYTPGALAIDLGR